MRITRRTRVLTLAAAGFCAIVLIALWSMALHATIVKKNLTALLGSVSPVPSSSQEAHGKCIITGSEIEVNPSIKAIKNNLESAIKECAMPYGMEDAISKGRPSNMPTEEEIERMSDAEKIAMAMKLRNDMGMGGRLQVKDTQAWAECIKLNNELAKLGGDMTLINAMAAFNKRKDAAHDKIEKETEAGVNACPFMNIRISGGDLPRDPACVKAKKLGGADRHMAEAAKNLAEMKAILAAHASKVRPLAARGDALLARVKFGEGMDNQARTGYMQMEAQILNQILALQTYAMESYVDAAGWTQKKKDIEKQK